MILSTKRIDQHTATVISQVPAVVAIVVHCHEDLALSRLEDLNKLSSGTNPTWYTVVVSPLERYESKCRFFGFLNF